MKMLVKLRCNNTWSDVYTSINIQYTHIYANIPCSSRQNGMQHSAYKET